MILGLLSDTHGHVERARQAAEMIAAKHPDAVVHAGDIGSEAVLVELAAVFDPLEVPVHAVLGNVDIYDPSLFDFPDSTVVRVQETAVFELAGTRVGVIHGHDGKLLRKWIEGGSFDLICTGHTHRRSDRVHQNRSGETRVVNPGAVYRAPVPGCAVLDLDSGELTYLDLEI